MRIKILSAPFPWFGGKSRVAKQVWDRFGNVPNYVEPFFGSGAVLLGRPHLPQIETVNDKDCFVANFWRALQRDPDKVAYYADWPVNEADQHARHLWLVNQKDWAERMKTDPDYYDSKIAGWWVWGISLWIGSGWCMGLDGDSGQGVPRKRVHLSDSGQGVHRKRVHLSGSGQGVSSELLKYMRALADRLRRVRVCCGDWERICSPSPTVGRGVTGVFLDPPYAAEAGRTKNLYSVDDLKVSHAVRQWALEWGRDKRMRIALCGYKGEHEMPKDWEALRWTAAGGYGNQGVFKNKSESAARTNRGREVIWFSPHCRPVSLAGLL